MWELGEEALLTPGKFSARTHPETIRQKRASAVGDVVFKVTKNSNGSDVIGDGQLAALVARNCIRQSDFVPLVVVSSNGPSSRSLDAAALVENSDGVGTTVGDEHQPVVVGAYAVRLQQRPFIDVRWSTR